MMTMNVLAGRRLTVFGLVTALVLGQGLPANAQFTILNPDRLPDLSVSVNAPSSMFDYEWVTIKVVNNAPTTGAWRAGASSDASVVVDLTNLKPFYVQASKSLSCSFGNQDTNWGVVSCTGSMSYGSTATISVLVTPSEYLCRPSYADASVWSTSGERSNANNRAIARIDLSYCIS